MKEEYVTLTYSQNSGSTPLHRHRFHDSFWDGWAETQKLRTGLGEQSAKIANWRTLPEARFVAYATCFPQGSYLLECPEVVRTPWVRNNAKELWTQDLADSMRRDPLLPFHSLLADINHRNESPTVY